jgi:hypothetical protein
MALVEAEGGRGTRWFAAATVRAAWKADGLAPPRLRRLRPKLAFSTALWYTTHCVPYNLARRLPPPSVML